MYVIYKSMHAKDLINHNKKMKCECGGSYFRNSKCRHLQTKKHNDYLKKDDYRIEFQIQSYKKTESDVVLIQIPKYVDF